MISPFASPRTCNLSILLPRTSTSNADLIHLAFLPLLKTSSPPLEDTCFDPYFSPFEIKSRKKAWQNNIAQREKLVGLGVSSMNHDPIV